MSKWFRRAVCLLLLFPLVHTACAAHRVKDLPARYRRWVTEDVAYIISSNEKKQFIALNSDAERDRFIRAFWAERNPNPGSGVNSYKQEHYARLAYANEHFGNLKAQDGWQTDRGRIYITLGPPEQKADYELARNVRPMQIWFYQSTTPVLPTHFYIVFYKPSEAEGWQLYSPVIDGPTRLVTTLRGKNDPQRCLDIIRQSLGDEVARTVVSFLPTAPVDLSNFSPDLESDALLSDIKGLADNPLTLEQLAERRATNVTSTIFYGGDKPALETATFRGADNRMTVSYLLRLPKPDPALIGKLPDGKTGYRVTLLSQVSTLAGAPVYSDEQLLTGELGAEEVHSAQSKLFGVEGRLPLTAGKYQLVVTLTNDLNHAGYRQSKIVAVPSSSGITWGMSHPLAFSPRPPVVSSKFVLPFTIAGIRFVPTGVKDVWLHHGDTLRVAFQLWSKPLDPAKLASFKIRVHYAYGSVSGGAPQQETEEIEGTDFDASGNLLSGHTFSTANLVPGNYRLVITATNESTNQNAYATMSFHVVESTDITDMWTVYDTPAADNLAEARGDFKRGLSSIASGNTIEAAQWFKSALDESPGDPNVISHLVECYAAMHQGPQIAALSEKYPQMRDITVHAAVLMARADIKQGNAKRAEQRLEFELKNRTPSAELYEALADTYQQLGETAKAQRFRKKAAKL